MDITKMRRLLTTLLFFLMITPACIMADSYNALWKQAELARNKDLPREEIDIMARIMHDAESHKDYGQLLAARFRTLTLWGEISRDSLDTQLTLLEQMASQAERADPTLAAVCYTALAKTYQVVGEKDRRDEKVEHFVQKALIDPASLATHQIKAYEPLVKEGIDGHIFQHDLLHVIGFETKAYKTMHDYYVKSGNRKAACITACYMMRQDRREETVATNKSRYLNTIDSLMHEYQDLQEAGELAIEHYNVIAEAEDVGVEGKVNFINYALNHWGKWSRMNVLRNAKSELVNPTFSTSSIKKVFRPDEPIKVVLEKIRNIKELTMTISQLNITADNNYDPDNKEDLAKLRTLTSPYRQINKSLRFLGQQEFQVLTDSFQIAPLSVGAYLMEIKSDNKEVPVSREIFYVSDMAVIHQPLPGNLVRYVAVSATTGQPIPGATIILGNKNNRDGKMTCVATLTADSKGEATYNSLDKNIRYVYACTDKDKFTPPTWQTGRFSYSSNTRQQIKERILTDRSIYRPGQIVHVAVVRYEQTGGLETMALQGENTKLTLYDANGKEVTTHETKTDTYGTAWTDFVLPQNGLTGRFFIRSDQRTSCAFNVEEYKRPTFEISFPEVNHRYQSGDTVVVKGSAKTYAGIPVSDAKVGYKVTRRPSLWCWWGLDDSKEEEVYADTLVTDGNGQFSVAIPLTLPKENSNGIQPRKATGRFYRFDITADVTDLSGESHHAEMSIPLGTRTTAFNTTMAKRVEKDSLRQYSFIYKNAMGNDISSTVRYRIDNGEEKLTQTNITVIPDKDFHALRSGKHTLTAICETDTLCHEFFLFTMQDPKPTSEVAEWFYQTSSGFHPDNKPVYLQVGSSDKDVHVVYSLISGNTVLEQGTMELSDSIVTRAFTYEESYGGGLSLNFSWIKEGVFHNYHTTIQRPMPDKTLQLEWTTFRDRLSPGQDEEWKLHISRPDGTPAQAQLMSVLYDKSLDQLKTHDWKFNLHLYVNLPNTQWTTNMGQLGSFRLSNRVKYKAYGVRDLDVDTFDSTFFPYAAVFHMASTGIMGTRAIMAKNAMMDTEGSMTFEAKAEDKLMTVQSVSFMGNEESVETSMSKDSGVQLRENLNETAFFFPNLESDGNGQVSLRFTLPESVTTWKMMGIAHDKEMNVGMISDEIVACKKVMIQPNMPRFLRDGDSGQIVCRVSNTDEKDITGIAQLELLDPETMKVAYSQSRKYSLKSGEVSSIVFDVLVKDLPSLTICKVTASGKDYDDGEQHYLPILPKTERIINTLPFICEGKGEFEIDLGKLTPKDVADDQVSYTLEYTHDPAWIMIQALPTVGTPDGDNAISLSTAYYANSIASHLLHQVPHLRTVLELWKRESGEEGTLVSPLAKNEELRQLILKETPWVLEADKEREQRQLLINYLDSSQVNYRLSQQFTKLAALQRQDGSFSWWKGMSGNRYVTTAVAETLVRLHKMTGKQNNTRQMLKKAISYLANETHEEVTRLKNKERQGNMNVTPSQSALAYLYIIGIDATKLTTLQQQDKEYLMELLSAHPSDFSIYDKARYAVILAMGNKEAKAKEYLRSIKEYSVYREDMGRYFDTPKAPYSWMDYKIPTEVAAIEALCLLTPEDTQTINEMRRWLLRCKQTQAWDTPINTVNAVYAFLNRDMSQLSVEPSKDSFFIDGKPLSAPVGTAAIGYVKTSLKEKSTKLTVTKKTDAMSWGAVYAVFHQSTTQVEASSSGINVSREIIGDTGEVGNKAKVRITITADRDYDFVAIVDKRAACLEPVQTLSKYHKGYYTSPRDNATYYYFDSLAKGKHVIETEYYIDRQGTYHQGTCYAECAYSPEFRGYAPGNTITIK